MEDTVEDSNLGFARSLGGFYVESVLPSPGQTGPSPIVKLQRARDS
jgi:hypothetical protein